MSENKQGVYRIFAPHEQDTRTDLELKREWLCLLAAETRLMPGAKEQIENVIEEIDNAVARGRR